MEVPRKEGVAVDTEQGRGPRGAGDARVHL